MRAAGKPIALLVGVAVVASTVTFLAVRARAAGIPDTDVLTYTGYLENPDGSPVTGNKSIGLSVYDAETDGNEVCTLKPSDIEPVAGRFQLALPEKCTASVKANPDLWLEVMVEGALLGRTKLGAVPYAIEAAHATSADVASDAHGALADRLDTLLPKERPSAVRAYRDVDQTLTGGVWTVVDFTGEELDLNSEFDLASDTFTPKVAGYYNVECSVAYSAQGTTNIWHALVAVNGVEVSGVVLNIDGHAATPRASYLAKLSSTDKVQCVGLHHVPTPMKVLGLKQRTFFSAFRLAGL
jgi:hypothetical protein